MPTVAIGAHRFYYEEQGSGVPVLLVHETGGSVGLVAAVARELASSYRVISYDRRGFGRSEAPLPGPADHLQRSADDAATLLRELGAPRALVIGWGLGAVIALALAVRHADAVSQVVLVDPLLHARKQLRVRVLMAAALGFGRVGLQRRGAKRYLRFVFGQGQDDEKHSAFDALDAPTRQALLGSPRTVLAEIDAGTGEELRPADLARIPAVVIVGDRSAPFLQEAAERTARATRTRVTRVPSADHAVTQTHPAALVATVRAALASAGQRGRT